MSIIYFILILGVIITVHEFGHLLAAKAFKVYCKEFSIGMGPKIFSKKTKETEYSLRALPIGGFVSMAGEEGVDGLEDIPVERTLTGISPLRRIIVMSSGIVLNIVLGFILFISIYLMLGYRLEAPPPIIDSVIAGSPAETAGFKSGDVITMITLDDGSSLENPKDFYKILDFTAQQTDKNEMTYVVNRDGQTITIKVTPKYDAKENRYLVGMQLPSAKVIDITFLEAVQIGVKEAFSSMGVIFGAIFQMIRGIGLDQLSGPLGILDVTDQVVAQSQNAYQVLINLLNLTALLSINIGIFNLIPLPIFDGGRILITAVEMIMRKPVNKKLEQILMATSVALLLALFIFIMGQDIFRIFGK